ncbi:MAG: hypothetical protein ACTSUE_14000 [Promethearchaeota archaeon]
MNSKLFIIVMERVPVHLVFAMVMEPVLGTTIAIAKETGSETSVWPMCRRVTMFRQFRPNLCVLDMERVPPTITALATSLGMDSGAILTYYPIVGALILTIIMIHALDTEIALRWMTVNATIIGLGTIVQTKAR